MNLPPEVLDDAKRLLDPAQIQASDYLKKLKLLVDEHALQRDALEDERQATAEKYSRLDVEFAHREAERRSQFESQLAHVIREFTAESERLVNTVKDRVAASRLKKEAEVRTAELRRSAAVRLRKHVENAPASSAIAVGQTSRVDSGPSRVVEGRHVDSEQVDRAFADTIAEIRERDRVLIRTLNREGIVESINDNSFTVLVGSLRFRARREELELVQAAAPLASKRAAGLPSGVSAAVSIDENFNSEINVIGSTVDEATDRVDKFLDAAYMAGVESVRIVHGHGKGALRRAVADLLAGHPHIQSFQAAPANQGGAGATIAVLRK
jgi:DNA mismatch repair protein MutS2